jgi:serine/threonine protein kinase
MKFKVKDDFAGRNAHCSSCKQPFVVPQPQKTVAYSGQGPLDDQRFSFDAGVREGRITLERADSGALPGQTSVQELLNQRTENNERYVIEKEIARGGMGAVLRAVDCDIRREVAVKYLLDQSNPRRELRFVEEAQITGQLEHPNIVPIHELSVDARGRLFFTMKIIRGRSLAEILNELRLNPRVTEKEHTLSRLLNIFVNICNPVAYAHSRAVVNRDLKPANVMVGEFGEVYVMDWGLAKVLNGSQVTEAGTAAGADADAFAYFMGGDEVTESNSSAQSKVATSRGGEADLTKEGSVMGTPVYMPPEQARGEVQAIDPRCDIYSLGAILYEMLTLQPPIEKQGGYPAILARVIQGDIQPPEQRNPERARAGKIPKELSAIAMKALAKEPSNRYPKVEALRQDIERFQEGHSVSAKQDTFREIAWKLVKRNRLASAFTALLAIVLVCSSIVNWLARRDVEKARADLLEKQTELVTRTRTAVPALVVAARQIANANNLEGARKQVELALLYEPKDADAHLLKGQLLVGDKEWTAARAELQWYLQQRNNAEVRKLFDLCDTEKVNDPETQLAVAEALTRQNMPGPAIHLLREFAAKRERRQPLLALYRKQIEANWPGLGDRLRLRDDGEFDLNLGGCEQVTSLEPLSGMQLGVLALNGTSVRDLSPLASMPLSSLLLYDCKHLQDLTALKGMPLRSLSLARSRQVRDLAALKGMPLFLLHINGTQVQDLTPLEGMKLQQLIFTPRNITSGIAVLRTMKSLKLIDTDWPPNAKPAEFWKRYDAGEFKK